MMHSAGVSPLDEVASEREESILESLETTPHCIEGEVGEVAHKIKSIIAVFDIWIGEVIEAFVVEEAGREFAKLNVI